MKFSFIATVLNEEKTIRLLLDSLVSQTKKPDEVIIVDGYSIDNTFSILQDFKKKYKNLPIQIVQKKGNRAVGRNEAIRQAQGDIVLCSDPGCILDKNWVKNITEPFYPSTGSGQVDVVAGYYKGKASTAFEKSLVPYVLVMEDKVDPKHFLPASRSMAFRKEVWKKIRGFSEDFSYNEDYVFAQKLKKIGSTIVFKRDAIVYWLPRKDIREASMMFFNFAYGDAQAKILRPKVILIFVRYLIAVLLFFAHQYQLLFFLLILYILWSIIKNYRYVKHRLAIIFLPTLQLVSDITIIAGTVYGLFF